MPAAWHRRVKSVIGIPGRPKIVSMPLSLRASITSVKPSVSACAWTLTSAPLATLGASSAVVVAGFPGALVGVSSMFYPAIKKGRGRCRAPASYALFATVSGMIACIARKLNERLSCELRMHVHGRRGTPDVVAPHGLENEHREQRCQDVHPRGGKEHGLPAPRHGRQHVGERDEKRCRSLGGVHQASIRRREL